MNNPDIFGSNLLFSNVMILLGFDGETVNSQYGYIFRAKPNNPKSLRKLTNYFNKRGYKSTRRKYSNTMQTVIYRKEDNCDHAIVDIDSEAVVITYYTK